MKICRDTAAIEVMLWLHRGYGVVHIMRSLHLSMDMTSTRRYFLPNSPRARGIKKVRKLGDVGDFQESPYKFLIRGFIIPL